MLFFVVLVVLFVFGCSECRLNAGFLLCFVFFLQKVLAFVFIFCNNGYYATAEKWEC